MGRLQLLGLALVLAGCQPVVDGKFSDVEVTRPDNPIPGAPATMAQPSVTFQFLLDSTSFGANANPDAQDNIASVELYRLTLKAKSGISDLSFIESLHALACVPIDKSSNQLASARQVEIADYRREFDLAVGASFDVPMAQPVDLLPLLRPSSTEPRRILVIVNLGGKLPTSDWKADITLSLSMEIRQ